LDQRVLFQGYQLTSTGRFARGPKTLAGNATPATARGKRMSQMISTRARSVCRLSWALRRG
jgi:hypothetical protein